jgi:hypothetical protein
MTQALSVDEGLTLQSAERSVTEARTASGLWSGDPGNDHRRSTPRRKSHPRSASAIMGSVGIVTAIPPGKRTSTLGATEIQTSAHARSGKRYETRKKANAATPGEEGMARR